MTTNTRVPYILLGFAALLFLGQGCVPEQQISELPAAPAEPSAPDQETQIPKVEPGDSEAPSPSEPPQTLPEEASAQEQSSYEDFSEDAFEQALAAGRPVYLYFYANWCPFCREQDPRNQEVIPKHPGGILGLRIHILDNETGALEERYADRYNVTYQHTAIYFKDGQEAFRRIGTQSNEQLNADLNSISQ